MPGEKGYTDKEKKSMHKNARNDDRNTPPGKGEKKSGESKEEKK